MPEPVNQTVKTVDQIIQTAIMGAAVNAAWAAATAASPWLGLPIIRTIFKWALDYVFGFADKYIEQAAGFAIIDGQTSSEARAYGIALEQLKTATAAGNTDAVTKATDDFKAALARLIHFDGS